MIRGKRIETEMGFDDGSNANKNEIKAIISFFLNLCKKFLRNNSDKKYTYKYTIQMECIQHIQYIYKSYIRKN